MKTFCTYYNEKICQSCDLITLDYSTQVQQKEKKLLEALHSINHPLLLKTVSSPLVNFRNKAKFIVNGTAQMPYIGHSGQIKIDEKHEVLNCPVHIQKINDTLPIIKEFISLCTISPYNISTKKGEIKGLIIFHAEDSNSTYLRFILRSKESVDRIKKHSQFLLDKIEHLQVISANIQPIPHAILEGEEEIFLTERRSIDLKIMDTTIPLNPKAFVQTNQIMAQDLYKTAARWINESGKKSLIELYCGQGAFSFSAANSVNKILGIEINSDAVDAANLAAKNNNITHALFKQADATKVIDEIEIFKPEILLVNPPRRGLGSGTDIILQTKPSILMYSSCNYETLAADLVKLHPQYSITKIQIFDMFPHTKHFETLVELKLN